VLEHLQGKHPIIREIIDYRQITKLKSTYADGLLKVIAPDGRIHTNFQMTVAAHRKTVVHRPESAEHPRPQRAGRRAPEKCSWPGREMCSWTPIIPD
jgi:DNA polymerase-1